MSAEDKNKLDDIFKQGLGEPDTFAEYNDQDWDDMEALLDAGKPAHGIVYWIRPVVTGMAALLLLFLGWWFFKPNTTVNTNTAGIVKPKDSNTVAAITPKVNTQQQVVNPLNTQTSFADHTAEQSQPVKGVLSTVKKSLNALQSAPQYAGISHRGNSYAGKTPVINKAETKPSGDNHDVTTVADPSKQNVIAANAGTSNTGIGQTGNVTTAANSGNTGTTSVADQNAAIKNTTEVIASVNTDKPADGANTSPVTTTTPAKKTKVSSASGFKPQFGIAMLLAPDVNGVGTYQNAKVGENVGLMLSVSVSRKLTISTGVAYSRKPYEVGFADYHVGYKFKTDPDNVYADCRVLDIPINVDYKLYHRSRNSVSVGTGLSSYIMLRETYDYNYSDPTATGPASFSVVNKNRHILGVMNLNATYEHQLNNKFSIAAQPFMKIPLTGIGNSQVRLQSTGLALGVKWNVSH